MEYKIKDKIIRCGVGETSELGVGLINDRSGIKGILKIFFPMFVGIGFSYFIIRIAIFGAWTNPVEILIPIAITTIMCFLITKLK